MGDLEIDRGFWEGGRIGKWPGEYGIEVTVPLKSTMEMLGDRRGLSKLEDDAAKGTVERKGERDSQGNRLEDVKVIGFSELTSLDSHEGQVKGLLGVERKGGPIPVDKQGGFLTTKPLRNREEVLAA